jgi:hypothetical protein
MNNILTFYMGSQSWSCGNHCRPRTTNDHEHTGRTTRSHSVSDTGELLRRQNAQSSPHGRTAITSTPTQPAALSTLACPSTATSMPQCRDDNTTPLVIDAATQGRQYDAARRVLALNATTLGYWDACERGVMTRASCVL